MPDGKSLEQRIKTLQLEINRLWRALLRLESTLTINVNGLKPDAQPLLKRCRICGATTYDTEASIVHTEDCPFAELAFPVEVCGEREVR